MRVIRRAALVTMAAAICIVAGSPAEAARNGDPVLDASQHVAGFTSAELIGEEWRQILELPLDVNPLNSQAAMPDYCLSAGHKHKVLIVWTTSESDPAPVCDVKPGTPVFFYTVGGECSSVEPPPFFGETEEQQRQCILDWLGSTGFDAILVSIDGGRPVNIGVDRFLAVSDQGTANLPDPNILGVPDRQATFVAAGYAALLQPLPPGMHTITVTIVGGPYDGTHHAVVSVVPGRKS